MNAKNKKIIGFIGGGNMGEAILASILKSKIRKPSEVAVAEPDSSKRQKLKRKYKVQIKSNRELAAQSSTLILAVKPQQMTEVLQEIKPVLSPKTLIISIAAGLDTAYFKNQAAGIKVIRVMPNMGLMVGEGASVLFANSLSKSQDKKEALQIFSAGGFAVFVDDESLIDHVTALSGSGPAFIFAVAQALIEAGKKLGLSPKLSHSLTLKTLSGAAKILSHSSDSIETLISRVASKGGTTEAGLKVMNEHQVAQSFLATLTRASQRAKELRCSS